MSQMKQFENWKHREKMDKSFDELWDNFRRSIMCVIGGEKLQISGLNKYQE